MENKEKIKRALEINLENIDTKCFIAKSNILVNFI